MTQEDPNFASIYAPFIRQFCSDIDFFNFRLRCRLCNEYVPIYKVNEMLLANTPMSQPEGMALHDDYEDNW